MSIEVTRTIRQSLLKSLFIGGCFALALAAMPIAYFSMKATQREKNAVYQATAHTLAELVRTPIEMSNYGEAQRLLGIVSEKGHLNAALVTQQGDLLLSDYAQRAEFTGIAQQVQGCESTEENVYCEPLISRYTNATLGYVILVPTDDLSHSVFWYLASGVALAVFILGFFVLALKTLIDREIVSPLESLRAAIESADLSDPASLSSHARFKVSEIQKLLESFVAVVTRFKSEQLLRDQIDRQSVVIELATQVAHDIRSPLSALKMAEMHFGPLSEDVRQLVKMAVTRITDIANQLLERSKSQNDVIEGKQSYLVADSVEKIVSEKRMQYAGRAGVRIELNVDESARELFASVEPVEFQRIISNLVDNSVEAFERSGTIAVTIAAADEDRIEIVISDNGKGIPADLLPQLGQRGLTVGKQGGSGLGLHHAKESIRRWGGQFEIRSVFGRSTTVQITLEVAPPPAWFAERLRVAPGTTIVSIDDDQSIHAIWDKKAQSIEFDNHDIDLIHFGTLEDFKHWKSVHAQLSRPIKYLLDYEFLGSSQSGLDLAKELAIERDCVLVTSRSEDRTVLAKSAHLGIRIRPKISARYFEFEVCQ